MGCMGPSAMRQYFPLAIAVAILTGLAGGAEFRSTKDYAAGIPGADEVWPTKKIMVKLYVGKPSLMSALCKDIQMPEPDWRADEKRVADIIRLMSALTRQKPLRGSQEAWDKLVRDYVEGAKAARQNVKEHRLQPARAALERVISTCDECHDHHGIK